MRFQPLLIRADLAVGIAQSAPWGISLDGLLAAELWADHKARQRSAGHPAPSVRDVDDPPDLDLPLARCELTPGQWHWAATCAHPDRRPAGIGVEIRNWTGRLDHRHLEQLTPRLPKVQSDRQGRYRARNMPLIVTPTTSVSWHAVGDPDRIRALLDPVAAIGKHRGTGEGQVLRWEVTTRSELDVWVASHLHPDGTLGRPTPPSCLTGRAPVADGGAGIAGIRPPYMHRGRQCLLRLPALLDS